MPAFVDPKVVTGELGRERGPFVAPQLMTGERPLPISLAAALRLANAQAWDVGIAAQQALGNVFAGLVLLFARPFAVGEAIRLRAGALGGTLDGTVVEIGITYVRLDTGSSVMHVPNSQVLNAVIGPLPPAEEDDTAPPAAADGKPGTPGAPEQPQPSPPGPA